MGNIALDQTKEPSLSERLSKFNDYERGAMVGQAINLAQNHILNFVQPTIASDKVIKIIRDLVPFYLELILDLKERLRFESPPF